MKKGSGMKEIESKRVINGTFGEIWINGEYMAECTGLEAKVSLEKTEVNMGGTLAKGYKVTGIDCKGTIKMDKVTSYFIEMMSGDLKKGRSTVATIITNLSDPDAYGAERIQLDGCLFDEMTLANWEKRKLGEESIPFTFSSWELLDTIAHR